MTQHIIDSIYECAFSPELWPGVLDEIAKIADARGGFIFSANTEVLNPGQACAAERNRKVA